MSGEAKLEKKLSDCARKLGAIAIKVGHSGWPDRVIVFPGGRTVWVEVKAPDKTGRISPLQQHRIDTLLSMGHEALFVDSEEDFPC